MAMGLPFGKVDQDIGFKNGLIDLQMLKDFCPSLPGQKQVD